MMDRDKYNAHHTIALIDRISKKAMMMVDELLKLLYVPIEPIFLITKSPAGLLLSPDL